MKFNEAIEPKLNKEQIKCLKALKNGSSIVKKSTINYVGEKYFYYETRFGRINYKTIKDLINIEAIDKNKLKITEKGIQLLKQSNKD